MPQAGNSFGPLIKGLRERRGRSLSSLARALKISVVYYRDVELGKRRPFSLVKVDYHLLAHLLGSSVETLLEAAAIERGQLEFDFSAVEPEKRRIAVLFALSIAPRRRILKADIRRLKALLKSIS